LLESHGIGRTIYTQPISRYVASDIGQPLAQKKHFKIQRSITP